MPDRKLDTMLTKVFSNERLRKLYEDLENEAARNPSFLDALKSSECLFIPYVGRSYRTEAKKKILFVGREPWGSGEIYCRYHADKKEKVIHSTGGGYECPMCHRKVLDRLIDCTREPASLETLAGCINNVAEIMLEEGQMDPKDKTAKFICKATEDLKEKIKTIAWTDLIKTSVHQQGPLPIMTNFLNRKFQTLPQEIELLDPDRIWFFTSHTYDHYLRDIFPKFSTEPFRSDIPEKYVARVYGIYDKAIVIRTSHPARGWTGKGTHYPKIIDDLNETGLTQPNGTSQINIRTESSDSNKIKLEVGKTDDHGYLLVDRKWNKSKKECYSIWASPGGRRYRLSHDYTDYDGEVIEWGGQKDLPRLRRRLDELATQS